MWSLANSRPHQASTLAVGSTCAVPEPEVQQEVLVQEVLAMEGPVVLAMEVPVVLAMEVQVVLAMEVLVAPHHHPSPQAEAGTAEPVVPDMVGLVVQQAMEVLVVLHHHPSPQAEAAEAGPEAHMPVQPAELVSLPVLALVQQLVVSTLDSSPEIQEHAMVLWLAVSVQRVQVLLLLVVLVANVHVIHPVHVNVGL
jgi:hypothetical protein